MLASIMPVSRRTFSASALAAAAALLAGARAGPAAAEPARLTLYMVEQPGCIYCARWNDEIAPIYPKTSEGAVAPLERIQLRAPFPEGIAFKGRPIFTPTFILVADGAEVGRIEGYPGEDFFWGLLDELIAKAPGAAVAIQ